MFLKQTRGDKTFNFVNTVLLLIFLITIMYPLIYVVSASFSSPAALIAGKVWLWPIEPTLIGYEAVFKHDLIWSGFRNSLIYTVVGTTLNVILTIMAAYPLARKDFYGKNFIMFLFVFTTMFSGGLIPTYLLVKDLSLLNTGWSMIIPSALVVWNVIITRTYFQTTIPDEMLEAAQLDGCSDFQFVSKMVIPLAGPIIAVITLFYAMGHWNQYFNALIYLKEQSLFPLQLILQEVLTQNEVDLKMISDLDNLSQKQGLRDLLKYSLIVVASAPLLILYPFMEKHLVKGMMIGSLKG